MIYLIVMINRITTTTISTPITADKATTVDEYAPSCSDSEIALYIGIVPSLQVGYSKHCYSFVILSVME